ncbi:MAG: LysR family transcriptional regulator [Lachnospiraceae bacterium]|nr:LysR family transcriptional regulator [Lachnospiraceae bacterium]
MTLNQLRYVIAVANADSMSEAARCLFIAQPSLSAAIKELETEIGMELFRRTNRGISLTLEGEEFIGYARQVVEQYELVESKYVNQTAIKKKFSVSMQHYTFAVNAFIEMVKQFGMDEYEFAVRESRTYDVIEDVSSFKSEIGILYVNDFNRKVLEKIFKERELEFHEILNCYIYVYIAKSHPLAKRKVITLQELQEYPCLSFDQGNNNSFYFAEEVLSTYEYKQLIKANDRATMLNLMVGLNGYTLCSGIICEELNGDDYCAVKLDSEEVMTIGYIVRKGVTISPLGQKYLEEIEKYKDSIMSIPHHTDRQRNSS